MLPASTQSKLLLECVGIITQMRWDEKAPIPPTKVRLMTCRIYVNVLTNTTSGLPVDVESHLALLWRNGRGRKGQGNISTKGRRIGRTGSARHYCFPIGLPSFPTRDLLKISGISATSTFVSFRAREQYNSAAAKT